MRNDAAQAAERADRLARLLNDGAICRAGIVQARAAVADGLRPESLLQAGMAHTLGFASARLAAVLASSGGPIQGLMPLVFAAWAMLARRKFLKPAIGAGLVVATIVVLTGNRKH